MSYQVLELKKKQKKPQTQAPPDFFFYHADILLWTEPTLFVHIDQAYWLPQTSLYCYPLVVFNYQAFL